MSNLQDMSNFLFISMTGPKVVLQPLGWQKRHYTKMCVVHHNTLSDSFRIRIVWF